MVSIKPSDFLLAIFFLCTLILGDTYLIYLLVLIFFLTTFFLKIYKHFFQRNNNEPLFSILFLKKIIRVLFISTQGFQIYLILWIFFLMSLFISAFFTHHVPLTINNLFFYIASYLFFITFLHFDKKNLRLPETILVVQLVVFTLCVFSFAIQYKPNLANSLPGMNLIYSTYGHNHLGALLILILPVSWVFAFEFSKQSIISSVSENVRNSVYSIKKQNLIFFFPVFFSLSLLASFGRVVTFIGFLQLLLLFYFYIKKHSEKYNRVYLAHVALALVVTCFLSVLSLSLFYSLIDFFYSTKMSCPLPFLERQLCKQFTKESRPEYWRQGIEAIKDYPLVGYGPGTFILVSRKYSQNTYDFTSFSHNAFLQVGAESGIAAATSFFLLMLTLLVQCIRVTNKLKSPLFFGLSLGLISIYFDILLDFDWSFFGLFLLTLLWIALILKENNKSQNTQIKTYISRLIQSGNISMMVFIFFFCFLFFVTEGLIRAGFVQRSFTIFPYFYFQKNRYVESTFIKDPHYFKTFLDIYRFDSDITIKALQEFILENKDIPRTLKDAIYIDPWMLLTSDHLLESTEHLNKYEKYKLFQQVNKLFKERERPSKFKMSNEIRRQYANHAIDFGNEFYLEKEYALAGESYYLAYSFWPWVLGERAPIFDIQHDDINQLTVFLGKLDSVESPAFGKYMNDYGSALMLVSTENIEKKSVPKIINDYHRVIQIAPWIKDRYTERIHTQIKKQIDQSLTSGQVLKSSEITDIWYDLWKRNQIFFGWEQETALANYLMVAAKLAFMSKPIDGIDIPVFYKHAREIIPWIMLDKDVGIKSIDFENSDTDQLKNYALSIVNSKGLEIGWEYSKHTDLYYYLIIEYVKREDRKTVEELIEAYRKIQFKDNKNIKLYQEKLQLLANEELNKNDKKAFLSLLALQELAEGNYWMLEQIGNYFLMQGKQADAEYWYRKCSDIEPSHLDCNNNGWGQSDRYQKVGKIILGEKKVKEVFP